MRVWLKLLILLCILQSAWAHASPRVDQATLSLHGWVPQAEERLNLGGTWRFFPDRLLSESDMAELISTDSQRWVLKDVPGLFTEDSYLRLMPNAHFGFGSYVLEITDANLANVILGISLRADSAWRLLLYIEDTNTFQKIHQVGTPGSKQSQSVPGIADPLVLLPRLDFDRGFLILHVANFHYRTGSLWVAPQIGLYQSMMMERQRESFRDYFAFGAIFSLCIYYLALYLRRRDYANLFLTLFSLSILMRFVSVSPQIFSLFLSESFLSYEIIRKMEYGGSVLSAIFGVNFFISSFKMKVNPIVYRIVTRLSLFIVLYTLVLPAKIHTNYLWLMQLSLVISLIYGVWLCSRAVNKKRTGSIIGLIGIGAIFITGLNDMAIGAGVSKFDVFLLQYGLIILIYLQGQVVAELFAKAFALAESLSKDLKKRVEEKTRDISSIMNQVPLGICTVSADLKIDPVHSRFLEQMFPGTNVAGNSPFELFLNPSDLSSDGLQLVESAITNILDEDVLNYEVNAGHLPGELELRHGDQSQIFEFLWHPMVNEQDTVEKLLISIRDVTDLRSLQQQAAQKDIENRMIQELLALTPARIHKFALGAQDYLDSISRILASDDTKIIEAVDKLYILLHTLKGLARSYGLSLIASNCHDSESALAQMKSRKSTTEKFEDLRASIKQLQACFQSYMTINDEILGRKHDRNQVFLDRKLAQELIKMIDYDSSEPLVGALADIRESLLQQCYLNLGQTLHEIISLTAKAAEDLSKPTPSVHVADTELMMSESLEDFFHGIMVHLVRNAIDHGIESADLRKKLGKDDRGQITIEFATDEDYLFILMSDDGRGLDLAAIRKRLDEIGVEEETSVEELVKYIFEPEFSTRADVTSISGRGVGMAAVREMLASKGGSIYIDLLIDPETETRWLPFRFVICLPLALMEPSSRQGKVA